MLPWRTRAEHRDHLQLVPSSPVCSITSSTGPALDTALDTSSHLHPHMAPCPNSAQGPILLWTTPGGTGHSRGREGAGCQAQSLSEPLGAGRAGQGAVEARRQPRGRRDPCLAAVVTQLLLLFFCITGHKCFSGFLKCCQNWLKT